jgi:hypothetical protein
MSDARDVEKRWHDPVALRKAVAYGVGVIVVAGIAFAVFALVDKTSVVLASTVPAILFIGGVGALVKAYLVWRDRGTWADLAGRGLVLADPDVGVPVDTVVSRHVWPVARKALVHFHFA